MNLLSDVAIKDVVAEMGKLGCCGDWVECEELLLYSQGAYAHQHLGFGVYISLAATSLRRCDMFDQLFNHIAECNNVDFKFEFTMGVNSLGEEVYLYRTTPFGRYKLVEKDIGIAFV